MAKILSTVIRKGGSGKTTTAVNLASGLAKCNKKVLLVDFDSQANASIALGKSDPKFNIANAMGTSMQEPLIDVAEAIQKVEDFFLLTGSQSLANVEQDMSVNFKPQIFKRLKKLLEPIEDDYDYIIVDTPPSDGVLTYNALIASNGVIIPAQAHALAMKGVRQALSLVDDVKEANPSIEVLGILPTMLQANTNMGASILEIIKTNYADYTLPMAIPLTIKVAESQAVCKPLLDYAPDIQASKAYMELAKYTVKHYEKGGK